jgi:PhnB protein
MKLDLNISLAFNGQCEAAFRFYERCLNGTITFMLRWGESPMAADVSPDWGTKIYHSTLKIGDAVIQGGDFPPDRYEQPQGFSFVLQMNDPMMAESVFQALSENGLIGMPLQETFWAGRFGVVKDQFGITWTINCEKATTEPAGAAAV